MEQRPGTSPKEKARHTLGGLATGLFIDVPFLIDSLWRRADFGLNRERDYSPHEGDKPAALATRPVWRRLDFWLFALVIMFVGFGPIWDGFCTIFPPPASAWALRAIGGIEAITAAGLFLFLLLRLYRGYETRFFRGGAGGGSLALRRLIVQLMILVAAAIGPALLLSCGLFVWGMADERPCFGAEPSGTSWLHLAICLAAIAAFWMALAKWEGNLRLLLAQFVLVAIVAAATWLLGTDNEASNRPYQHVFAVAAPAAALVLVLAYAIGHWLFRRRDIGPIRGFLAPRLPRTELFAGREEPELTWDRLVHALVRGILSRPLMTLLLPALVGFMAPARYLDVAVAIVAFLSVFFLAWGSIAERWQQMVLMVERWFLRGASLAVSLFVILIAVLRVLRVDYVTTIVDSAPFGALFGIVSMGYVLSWLVEYWINRVVGTEVLGVLGAREGALWMDYPGQDVPEADVHVDREGRYMLWHAIGRFLVVGARIREGGHDVVRFHSHDLHGLLGRVGGADEPRSAALLRQVESYFFAVNALLAIVAVAFGWYYVAKSHGVDVKPVVTAANVPIDRVPENLKDLAKLLIADSDPPRPAIIVAASGGGTRAALYTAHVLEGLHRLKRDRDIVLLSGVSGGGVALTFYAAEFPTLSIKGSGEWKAFRETVSDKFIEDVLEGATEWRVLGPEPLSRLLVDSFDRRMKGPGPKPTFADIASSPALILNTTIVGHPADDSQVLRRSLDPAAPSDCAELARPFTSLTGGRLIFTDLMHVLDFPATASRLPDVRLPYRIVRDPRVSLAAAAALQANFPPVFPNARVVITGYTQAPECPDRSYFVTDGGAQENLGLVSALYALRSALARVEKGKRLRPIHFVLAEASATGYDFSQDRGLGAALSGAKERLTGGLTEELVAQVEALYRKVSGSEEANLEFHYLSLPLVFRSRGGFGTHWMQAEKITVHDPRDRREQTYYRVGDLGTGVTLDKKALESLWTDLHDPQASFCDHAELARPPSGKEHGTVTVRRWICTNRDHTTAPRDVHVEQWKYLVEKLRQPNSPGGRQ